MKGEIFFDWLSLEIHFRKIGEIEFPKIIALSFMEISKIFLETGGRNKIMVWISIFFR